jgi:putative FmdB family regulatory protein
MPVYAFECDACGHRFDRLQKLSDPDPETCPACGARAVRRALTAPAFRLKGSGWYETDFKREGEKKRNLAGDHDAGGKSDSKPATETPKTETKVDSKPAATPAAAAAGG